VLTLSLDFHSEKWCVKMDMVGESTQVQQDLIAKALKSAECG
jgi:hypothetical protein